MIAPACHPRIDQPIKARRQIFDHATCLPSTWTGNSRHRCQSAVGPILMREPWVRARLLQEAVNCEGTNPPGVTHEKPKVEPDARSSSCESSPVLGGVAISKP